MGKKSESDSKTPQRTFLECEPLYHKALRIFAAPDNKNLKDLTNEAVDEYLLRKTGKHAEELAAA